MAMNRIIDGGGVAAGSILDVLRLMATRVRSRRKR